MHHLVTAITRIPGIETANKIHNFMAFPVGWKYGIGIPASAETARAAFSLNLRAARSGLETNAFLGTDGEVRVTVYQRRTYLQFTIEVNGLIEYVRENGAEEVERRQLPGVNEALLILETFERELWHSSASSTATTTTTREVIFRISPSSPQGAARVFRSWTPTVPFELVHELADT